MKASELRKKYLEFFKKKGHAIIQSASIIPENDPTALFISAGMHPLKPFLMGQPHPMGKRITNIQKCIRTGDIEAVGDDRHNTFFEMMGNWSLGDYFKRESLTWSYEFLIKELGFDHEKMHVTVFAGDKEAPRDEEAANVWLGLGMPKERIHYLPKEDNFWFSGDTGPCGPDSEIFIDTGSQKCGKDCKPGCDCSKYLEIWNNVFMTYNKTAEGKFDELPQKNIDTGIGVERTITILSGEKTVYETELFKPIIKKIEELSEKEYNKNKGVMRAMRIISDHVKAAVMILGDERGIVPSNVDQGYVLRRLIRRSIRYGKELGMSDFIKQVALTVFPIYEHYPSIGKKKEKIINELGKEAKKFEKALEKGLRVAKKVFNKKIPIQKDKYIRLQRLEDKIRIIKRAIINKRQGKDCSIKEAGISGNELSNALITGKEAFYLYQSFGFPIEMIMELVREKFLFVDRGCFRKEFGEHQKLSRKGAEQKFKGGLADASKETIRLHTATHLLAQALRQVLCKDVKQRGSNITPERLRFDFNFDRKVTREELDKVEIIVNEQIKKGLIVNRELMSYKDAKKLGAQAEFEHKYSEKVYVYFIGDFSKEVCGGPHVSNIKELGTFKILKEESIAAGVRRIKAVLIS